MIFTLLPAVPLVAFGRYLVSAGAATCVDVVLVQLLLALHFASTAPLYAVAIMLGAICGMTVNFLVSRRFVFAGDQRSAQEQLASFFAISVTTLLLRIAAAFGLISLFALPAFGWIATLPVDAPFERAAHLGAVSLVTVYSFFAHKHISFAGGILALFASKSVARP